jgi:membrane AbrB-like protein
MENITPVVTMRLRLPTSWLVIAIQLGLAVLAGCGLTALGADGGAWMLGGILAGALVFSVYRSRYRPQAKPNREFRKLGQILVGLTIGFSIQRSNVVALSMHVPLFLALAVFIIGSGMAIGSFYARVAKTDGLTAVLATVPGNIGVMASIAADYGKPVALISLVQLLRFTAVTLLIPIGVNLATHVSNSHTLSTIAQSVAQDLDSFDLGQSCLLVLLLGLTCLAVKLGQCCKVPVAAFMCAIAVGLSFNHLLSAIPYLPAVDYRLPIVLNLIGQVLLGLTIGEYWGVNPKLQRREIAGAGIPVVLTFLAGLASAGVAMWLTDWDWLTCLLVTAPGGSPEMIWIALSLNHDVEIVTAGHLVRLIAISVCLPMLVSLASLIDRRNSSKRLKAAIQSSQ